MQAQLEGLQSAISQKCAPKQEEVPTSALLKQAIGKVNTAKSKPESTSRRHEDAEKAVAQLQEQMEQAAAEVLEAQQEHPKALGKYSTQSFAEGIFQKPQDYNTRFQFDAAPFEEVEDLEQEHKEQLARFRQDAASLQELLHRDKAQEEAMLAMVETAKKIKADHTAKKRRQHKFINENAEAAEVFAFTESHIPPAGVTKLKKDLSKDGWKAAVAAAAPTRRSREGTSGGELLIAKAHWATTTHDEMRETMNKQGTRDPFRGFAAVSLHLRGGNIALFFLDLLPGGGHARQQLREG
ncbi:unnamed protein product [Prorocentrum cordatum]|uniref:Uncharacterized protein n=1 Tax=Prorocentrum cordatum TaxID=2364126 RepID=A0ABN9X5Z2_9DINO|nr:unnamed protein product [Polarella glacialis]